MAALVSLVLAAGATGAALAASGHGSPRAAAPIRLSGMTRGAFLRATAVYLGTDVRTLRGEMNGHRTLASIVNATPGRSAKQLSAGLAAAAISRLELAANRALSNEQTRTLRASLRRAVAGFLDDTCPLGLAGLAEDLGGCSHMTSL